MKKRPIGDDDLLQALNDAAKAMNVDELIKTGQIKPDGNWYLVPDVNALPVHAQRKISKRRMTAKGLKVQFREPYRGVIALDKKLNRKRKA
ncbi:MAG: hypothetical protein DMF75_02600 [Acidobacteria bacterium]|nr:MAG: hypothetical protein DMF75_02600 [Acidobacteriota bacterium]